MSNNFMVRAFAQDKSDIRFHTQISQLSEECAIRLLKRIQRVFSISSVETGQTRIQESRGQKENKQDEICLCTWGICLGSWFFYLIMLMNFT